MSSNHITLHLVCTVLLRELAEVSNGTIILTVQPHDCPHFPQLPLQPLHHTGETRLRLLSNRRNILRLGFRIRIDTTQSLLDIIQCLLYPNHYFRIRRHIFL